LQELDDPYYVKGKDEKAEEMIGYPVFSNDDHLAVQNGSEATLPRFIIMMYNKKLPKKCNKEMSEESKELLRQAQKFTLAD
jgi:hypothetical protein